MRDSNHSFPSLNRACVSISSSLYDRRAIDSPVPTLPLLTSLQHLAYLTSTSPRIREILTVDGGLERLISIVETCIDLAYPERARKGRGPSSTSSSSSFSPSSSSASSSSSTGSSSKAGISGTSAATSISSRASSSDRKGKQPERLSQKAGNEVTPSVQPQRRMQPFKAFSAYANYPFTLDTDSDETSSGSSSSDGEDANMLSTMMDLTPSPNNAEHAQQFKAQRQAMTAHEREIRLLELERSFMRNFMNEYKDLPALVHTYGFALQCLVNVGVRGSESIRTRVVEAGVLNVVARILGGFLDYRSQEREKRLRILVAAQEAELHKERDDNGEIAGSKSDKKDGRERERHSRMTSAESDTTAVLSMSTRRERRERERDASQAAALADAQVQLAAINQQFQSQRRERYELALQHQQQQQGHQQQQQMVMMPASSGNTPLVAGMPAPANAHSHHMSNGAGHSAVSTTPRQTRSAAVQALLNSSTEIPTLAPARQYNSSVVLPSNITRGSPPRRSSSTGSSSNFIVQNGTGNLTTSSAAAGNSLLTAEHLIISSINRTNTPDTIASLDEVQEFSDVNQDENESITSSSGGQETGIMMDVIDASAVSEGEAQSTSAMMIASTVLSNPASRSVSRNRINANVLAQHRPVPPPHHHPHGNQEGHDQQEQDETFTAASAAAAAAAASATVQAPSMLGDVTVKLEQLPTAASGADDANDEGADSDVVMDRDNDREDHESTDDTGTSASPVSRPHSSQHMRHHHHHHLASPSSSRTHSSTISSSRHQLQQPLPRSTSHSSFDSSTAPAHPSSGGMQMDSETTPVSRPVPLRRQSSSAAVAATPRNAFTSATTILHAPTVAAELESHIRAQQSHLQPPSASQQTSSTSDARQSSTSTTRRPHTSTHVHLRLRPELQQSASTNPSIVRDGQVQLLLNYGPLMDHYIKEEDVLHCLHLLAYLSKYPHVRAVFHDPENEICKPPSASTTSTSGETSTNSAKDSHGNRGGNCCSCARKKLKFGEEGVPISDSGAATSSSASAASLSGAEDSAPSACAASAASSASAASACHGHCHAHAEHQQAASGTATNTHSRSTSSGSQKHAHPCCANDDEHVNNDEEAESLARARAMATMPAKDRKPALEPSRPPRSTANNVFSLVEQYTFRPSSPADRSMRLGTDIQYWAGVIMRNACRKDELRGGIRQCANMGCGVWERFPREFAKCRRCRKAKYCSKGCQRRAWQAGHRYWCSARQDAPPAQAAGAGSLVPTAADDAVLPAGAARGNAGGNDDDDDEEERHPQGVVPPGQAVPVNPAMNVGVIVDGITVGGDDGMNVEGGDRFDQRIRVGDGNAEMGMLDAM